MKNNKQLKTEHPTITENSSSQCCKKCPIKQAHTASLTEHFILNYFSSHWISWAANGTKPTIMTPETTMAKLLIAP